MAVIVFRRTSLMTEASKQAVQRAAASGGPHNAYERQKGCTWGIIAHCDERMR